jgi:phage gp36-like protein
MAYCTLADLKLAKREAILIVLTDPTGAAIVEAPITLAIARADGIINGKVAPAYSTPVTGSNLLKSLAIDITLFFIYGIEHDCPEEIRKKYEDAIAMLDKIGAGKVALDISATSTSPGAVISDPYNDEPDSGMVQPFHTLNSMERQPIVPDWFMNR